MDKKELEEFKQLAIKNGYEVILNTNYDKQGSLSHFRIYARKQ